MTTLVQVAAGTGAIPDVNSNFLATSQAGLFGRKDLTTAGLTFGYYGGFWGAFTISDGTVALTASTTNYVVVALASGTVSVSTATTNWNDTANYVRLHKIVTGSGSITSREDHRPLYGQIPSGVGTTQGKQAIYIAAGSMRPSSSGGCAALTAIAGASGQPDLVTLDFDATTQEYAQFSIVMPKKWNEGTITFVPQWSHASTTTNFGVVWSLQAVAVSDDDTIAVNFGTAQTSVDTGGTTDDLYIGPASSAITVAGSPAPEDMVFFRVSRVTSDGGDTMAIDARLHGITVYVTTNADTDA